MVTSDPLVLMSSMSEVRSRPPMSRAREREGVRKDENTPAIWLASSRVGVTTRTPVWGDGCVCGEGEGGEGCVWRVGECVCGGGSYRETENSTMASTSPLL